MLAPAQVLQLQRGGGGGEGDTRSKASSTAITPRSLRGEKLLPGGNLACLVKPWHRAAAATNANGQSPPASTHASRPKQTLGSQVWQSGHGHACPKSAWHGTSDPPGHYTREGEKRARQPTAGPVVGASEAERIPGGHPGTLAAVTPAEGPGWLPQSRAMLEIDGVG